MDATKRSALHELNWDDLRLLLAVSLTGSLKSAGLMTSASTSKVSRRMDRMEDALGQKLLLRGTNGCQLTPFGKSVVNKAKHFENELLSVSTAPNEQQDLSENIRISTGDAFVDHTATVIGKFQSENPNCTVHYEVDGMLRNLPKLEWDIAVRTVNRQEDSLVYIELARAKFGLFATKELAEQIDRTRICAETPTIGFLPPMDKSPLHRALQDFGCENFTVRAQNFTALRACIKNGCGIGPVARQEANGLLEVFPEYSLPDIKIYAALRADVHKLPHIKQFTRALITHFRAAV